MRKRIKSSTRDTLPRVHSPASGFKRTALETKGTLGEQFKEAREYAGLSRAACAVKLQIQEKYLEAIEQSDYEALPGESYARGWIKKYAVYLKIPEYQALETYNRERWLHKKIHASEYHTTRAAKRGYLLWEFFTLRRILLTILVIGIFGYISYALYDSLRPPMMLFESPLGDFRTQENSIIIKGRTEPGTTVRINNQPIDLDNDGAFKQEISLYDGLNTIALDARKKHSRLFSKQIQVFKTSLPTLQHSTTTGP